MQRPTRLLKKVRGHSAIAGNDAADALAKKASHGADDVEELQTPQESVRFCVDACETVNEEGRTVTIILKPGKDFLNASHEARVIAVCRAKPNSMAAKWAIRSKASGLLCSCYAGDPATRRGLGAASGASWWLEVREERGEYR